MMGGPFDKKGSGGDAGKRPTPTIEATATEVSVEPGAEKTRDAETSPSESENGGAASKRAALEDGNGTDKGQASETEQPAAPESSAARGDESKSFAAMLLGALTSFVTHAAAGLAGGLAVLFALSWGYLPLGDRTEAPDLKPLEDRIAKLEAAPDTPDNSADLKSLETRLGALESKTNDSPAEVAALADRVGQLEANLDAMAEAAEEGGSVADAAVISQQINEAEKRLEAKIEAGLAEAKAETGTDAAAIDALKKDLAEVDAKLKALTEAELGTGETAQILPEIAALNERVERIESELPSLIDTIDEDASETKSATLAIAFANLRAAVDDGRPYAAELATLAQLSPGAGDLGGLLDYEDTGIPTLRELTASFDDARSVALATDAPAGDASIIDRLFSSAESLVKIRRIDERAEGNEADAVLARAEAKLDQGALDEAVQEVEALQGAPREAFAKWLDAAKARLDADATLQHLQGILLVSLGGSGTDAAEDTQE